MSSSEAEEGNSLERKDASDQNVDGMCLVEGLSVEEMKACDVSTVGERKKLKRKLKDLCQTDDDTETTKPQQLKNIDFGRCDRLLTHKEKLTITCENKRIYNTKKKLILEEIQNTWLEDGPVPNFRNNSSEDVLQLQKFIDRLSEGENERKFLFPECALGRNCVKQMVMNHMRERRRRKKELEITTIPDDATTSSDALMTSDASSGEGSPPTGCSSKKSKYKDYFHPEFTQASCDTIDNMVLKKESVRDVQLNKHLLPLKKLFQLNLLRGQDKNTHIRAIANMLYVHGYVEINNSANFANITRQNVTILKTLQ